MFAGIVNDPRSDQSEVKMTSFKVMTWNMENLFRPGGDSKPQIDAALFCLKIERMIAVNKFNSSFQAAVERSFAKHSATLRPVGYAAIALHHWFRVYTIV